MKLNTPLKRMVTGLILVAVLAILCSNYATEYEYHQKYPSYGALISDYPEGEVVNVGGTVTHIGSSQFQILENYHGQNINLSINSSTPVNLEDQVSVVGVLGPNNTIIQVERVEVNEYWKYLFLLLRSFLAVILLIFIFYRYWSFDWKNFEFRRR